MEDQGYIAAADFPWLDYLRPAFDQLDVDDVGG